MANDNTYFKSSGSYEEAVAALYSPLHQSLTREALKTSRDRRTRTVQDMRTYIGRLGDDTAMYSRTMSIIHVTGTKGKGSTCSMCESLMRKGYGQCTGLFTSPHLVDIRERIRIQGQPVSKQSFAQAYWHVRGRLEAQTGKGMDDDGLPVLPTYFRMLTLMALYIFSNYTPKVDVMILEVGLGGRYDATNIMDIIDHDQQKKELVTSDSTVLITTRRTVCGVTMMDYDHMRVLGNTLEEIAWEKGGIFAKDKTGPFKSPKPFDLSTKKERSEDNTGARTSCLSGMDATANNMKVFQIGDKFDDSNAAPRFFALGCNSDSVLQVLARCAAVEGQGERLYLVGPNHNKSPPVVSLLPADCPVGLAGDHQRLNAQLALALCHAVMENRLDCASTLSPEAICRSLSQVSWPGRCQVVHIDNVTSNDHDGDDEKAEGERERSTRPRLSFYLDGAHTVQSIKAGLAWYIYNQKTYITTTTTDNNNMGASVKRILVFWCSHERNPLDLLQLLFASSLGNNNFDSVYFCRPDSERPSAENRPTAAALWATSGRRGHYTTTSYGGQGEPDNIQATWTDTLASLWTMLEHEQREAASAAKPGCNKTAVIQSNLTAAQVFDLLKQDEASSPCGQLLVFVTGSLYLVGSMLAALNWREDDAPGHLIHSSSAVAAETIQAV